MSETVQHEFEKKGAYFLSDAESRQLGRRLFPKGELDVELVGQSAETVAKAAGLQVPAGTKLLIAPQSHVPLDDGYRRQLLCPVLAWYVEEDWRHACEKCIELLLTEGTGHTLVIHSQDEAVIRQFALQKAGGTDFSQYAFCFGQCGNYHQFISFLYIGQRLGWERNDCR